jgi:hypothetical protein
VALLSPQLFQEHTMSESIVIVSAARTPMGGFQGDFSTWAVPPFGPQLRAPPSRPSW